MGQALGTLPTFWRTPPLPRPAPAGGRAVTSQPALVWGTDWPHPRPDGGSPDAARLLQVFLDWTTDPVLRKKILTDSPARLYDFPAI